jgi:hypothetical protein
MEVSSQFHAPTVLPLGKAPGTRRMGRRGGLDAMVKGTIHALLGIQTPVVQPEA